MQNSIYLNPRLISNRDNSSSLAAINCENLRLVENGDGRKVLTVVGQPDKLLSGDYTPLLVFNPAKSLLLKRERTLFVIPVAGGDLTELYTFDNDIRRAFACQDHVLVVTDGGSYRLAYDETSQIWQTPVLEGNYRAVGLQAVDKSILQQTVGERQLSKVYNNDFTPSDTDRRNITNDLVTAYLALAKTAREEDTFLQPALCRYRLRDEQGRILFTSPAVLVSASVGQQLAAPIAIGSDDRQTLDSYSIDAPTWQLQLNIAEGAMPSDDRVATLEVLMSPQLHPYDSSAAAQIMFTRRANSRNFLSLTLPGEPLTAATVDQLLSRMESMERVVASINRPFADSAQATVTIPARNPYSVAEEIAAVRKALRSNVTRIDSMTARLLPPHRFTAEVASTASGVTLWGKVKAERYEGFPLSVFAASTANRSWRAAVTVQFADGTETAVWQGQSTVGCPTTINPVLTYPSADAVKMTIALSASGQAPLKQSFDLSPDESGTCARYINTLLKPFELEASADAFVIPSANAVAYDLPDVIVATDAAQPQVAKAVAQLDCGTVTAIAAARVSQNAWDFGRSRFYVMTEQGINSVAVNAAMTALSVNLIDRRGVDGDSAVTVADDQVVVAAANGDLLAILSSRISTLRADTGYKQLAWVSSRRELWGIDSNGKVEVTCFDYDMSRYKRSGLTIRKVLDYAGGALAQTSDAVVNLDNETASFAQSINWSVSISPKGMDLFTPDTLRLDMSALSFKGTVTMSRTGLTTTPTTPDITANITGELRSPIILKSQTRPMRSLKLTIAADVAPDFRLAGCLHKYSY